MAITFKDAFRGMAEAMPQLINNYMLYLQYKNDYERTQSYTSYMEKEGKRIEVATEKDRYELKNILPLKAESEQLILDANKDLELDRKALREAQNAIYGSRQDYFVNKLGQEELDRLVAINEKLAQTKYYLNATDNDAKRLELQTIESNLTQTKLAVETRGLFYGMAMNEKELDEKVFKALDKQYPNGYGVKEMYEKIAEEGIVLKSPISKQFIMNGMVSIMEMGKDVIVSDSNQAELIIKALKNPDKQYNDLRKMYGVKIDTPISTVISLVKAEQTNYRKYHNPVQDIIEMSNAYLKASGLAEDNTYKDIPGYVRFEDRPQPVINPYDYTNTSKLGIIGKIQRGQAVDPIGDTYKKLKEINKTSKDLYKDGIY